jgi:hypothetical protein
MLTAQVMLKGLQKDRMDWIKELFLNYVLLFNIFMKITDTFLLNANKTDCHDITEILLKVALNTTNHLHINVNI